MRMATQKSFISFSTFSPPALMTNRNTKKHTITLATKQDSTENPKPKQKPILELRVPNVLVARAAIAVLGLGFIDAGYSGDWSRIEVISKQTEDLLKIAAYVIVPLCIFLIFSFTEEKET